MDHSVPCWSPVSYHGGADRYQQGLRLDQGLSEILCDDLVRPHTLPRKVEGKPIKILLGYAAVDNLRSVFHTNVFHRCRVPRVVRVECVETRPRWAVVGCTFFECGPQKTDGDETLREFFESESVECHGRV